MALKLQDLPGIKGNKILMKQVDDLVFKLGKLLGTKMCFVKGTKVHTFTGLRNIEDIRVGDLVLSRRDDRPSEDVPNDFKRVIAISCTAPSEILHLRVRLPDQGEEAVICTGAHPFFVIGARTFVEARELKCHDVLGTANGDSAIVESTHCEVASPGTTFTAYNLTVEECHTYFVGKSGIWVHNSGNLTCEIMQSVFDKHVAKGLPADEALKKVEEALESRVKNGRLTTEAAEKHLKDAIKDLKEKGKLGPERSSAKPDWLKRLEEGNKFNKENYHRYPEKEVYIKDKNGGPHKKLDSYDPDKGEIVSRKHTDLSKINKDTAIAYLRELQSKYPAGAEIADVPTTRERKLVGLKLEGIMILEVPVQKNGVPLAILQKADELDIVIRDINGHVYKQR
jgi:polyhydroxyalkanoate synthesis regulator phasin